MRAELKRMHSPDVDDLAYYQPQGSFGILVQLMIGPKETPGEEAFDTIVCSPDWLAEHAKLPDLVGDRQIVVDRYNYQAIKNKIQESCRSLEENDWQKLAVKLGAIGKWEFADYAET